MKKILFPIDFSRTALNAFAYAVRFAENIGAEIVTLHAFELPVGNYTDLYDFMTENYNISEWGEFENYRSRVPKLHAIAEQQGMTHVKISHVLENGATIETILAVAKREHADMIIMGTTGATGAKEVFLGSVAGAVMQKAEVPVMAIPQKATYQKPHNLLMPVTYRQPGIDSIKEALELAGHFGATLHLLEVKPEHEDYETSVFPLLRRKLKNASNVLFHIIASREIEGSFLHFIKLRKIDLVVIGVRKKSFFSRLFFFSLSRNLAYHASVPVLGIPQKKTK